MYNPNLRSTSRSCQLKHTRWPPGSRYAKNSQGPAISSVQNADPTRQLATGQTIPQIQLGLYMMSGKEAYQSTKWALSAGYRGFDSAQMYHNEREAGKAILDWLSSAENTDGLKREDIHYTSKLASCSTNYKQVRRSIKQSVDVSGLGYVDLFLLHSPYGGKEARLTSWKALEDAVEAGEVKMAGVSNFGVRHVSVSLCHGPLGRRKQTTFVCSTCVMC